MKASTSSPSYFAFSISTSCVVFILTTVIGNFGVSDADVALQQNKHSTPTSHSHSTFQGRLSVRIYNVSSPSARTSFSPPNTFSKKTSTTTVKSSPPVDLPEYQINLLQNLRFLQSSVQDRTSKSTSATKNEYPPASTSHSSSSFSVQEQDQLYFRLLPYSAQKKSPTPSGLHMRAVREVSDDELTGLEDSGDKKINIGYPLPLSADDYWALNKDQLLNQLVIRALANPEEWRKLRETLDKVDGDLKTLLSLERRSSQATFDSSSSINGSLGYSTLLSGNTSADISKTIPSSSSTQNQEKNGGADAEHHHHVKFAYHRVSDLNAAGQPTNRGIAAVVSLDSSAESGNESKNESFKSKSSSLKAFSGKSKPYSSLGANKMVEVAALTSSSKSLLSTSHSYGPTSSVRGSENSNSGNYNNNDNFRNGFSRLGIKEKYVDLKSDKNGGGANDESDNNRKSEKSASKNIMMQSETTRVHVIPPMKQSVPTKQNFATSHEIQLKSNLNHLEADTAGSEISNNISAKQLNLEAIAQHEEKELMLEDAAVFLKTQDIKVNYGDNDNQKELHHKRHHLTRHHHRHLAVPDDNFHKHHQFGNYRGTYHNLHYEPPVIETIGQHKHKQNHHQQHHHSTSVKHHITIEKEHHSGTKSLKTLTP